MSEGLKRVYGIDLGTTYSAIAYVDEHGKPVIIPNQESEFLRTKRSGSPRRS